MARKKRIDLETTVHADVLLSVFGLDWVAVPNPSESYDPDADDEELDDIHNPPSTDLESAVDIRPSNWGTGITED